MKNFGQLFKGLMILIIPLLSLSSISHAQFRVIAYLPNWGNFVNEANLLDYDKITHLNIAFLNPTNANGDIGPTTNLAAVVGIAHINNVKVLASIGGATSPSYYTALLATPLARTAFVAKLTQFALDYDLDGIDVDLEGNAVDANYEAFVTELKTAMVANNKLTTAAVATWYSNRITSGALAQFDFINIMTYDATGTWAPNNPGQHSPYADAESDLAFWGTTRGVPASKMSLGVPFYGYSFVVGLYSISWEYITANYPESIYNDEVYPAAGGGKFYNGIITIQKKTKLALAQAGGIMYWEAVFDTHDANSLLTAIDNIIQDNGANIAPTTSITSPLPADVFTENSAITITADADDVDGSIIKVEFYAGTFKIGEDYTAPYSIVWNNGGANAYNLTSVAYDNLSSYTTSSPIAITVNNISAPSAYFTSSWAIPGKIEVENFNWGPNNTSYNDATVANEGGNFRATGVDIEHCLDINGGYNIAYTAPGEWLEYDVNITADNLYSIESRVATNQSGTRTYHIEMDGQNVTGTISVPRTNGWQTWQTISTTGIALTQGLKKMRIVIDNGNLNMNFVKFSTTSSTSQAVDNAASTILYPNPCNDFITIEYTQVVEGNTTISIIDPLEKELIVIQANNITSGKQQQVINTSKLPAGVYFCKIKSTEGIRTLKMIKE